ncbi:dihydrodipicolinate synthase family protein [Armatimonas rosea]|uniref:N-acetylneuraminate lyase n=1 Tax=Armatimonas rosea TaxID=685828 RepID=A0A7W9SVR4_ARMRO|nr:dihydrodipicolinate synthase family protein [Armatimonas rosea]MBB6053750.1 N-acetylneuraminate lyase [Armatimonas rosea]
MKTNWTGLIAAPHTPFAADGSLNLGVIEKQCEKLITDGVIGAFVCGSTGEGVSLSGAERKAVARRWVELAAGRLKVIVHVGHTSIPDAAELAADAQAAGADGISALAPYYFKPAGVGQLLDFMAPVAAAAPELPFFYYHIPALTGAALPMIPLLEQATDRIPSFAGLKFTHNDLLEFAACLRFENGRYDIFWGSDECMLPALSVGAVGFVGSTYNYSAPLYHKLRAAFAAGDQAEARRLSDVVMDAVRALLQNPGLPSGKAIMEGVGVPVGAPRPPLRPLTAAQAEVLVARLWELGAL